MLDREGLVAAFDELGALLHARGLRGTVFVVGGAALALAFDARRTTRDVDAVFEPKAEVYRAARDVAGGLGLPEDWLNDAVKGFLPGPDPAPIPVYESPGLAVAAGSARYLLALKLLASRVEQDVDDIRFLFGELGLTTPAEGLAILSELYPQARLAPRTRLLLEEMFGPA